VVGSEIRTMDKRCAIEASIADYAKRLSEISQGDEQSKRVKKRILQKLGKLKKDLAALGGNSAPEESTEAHSGSKDTETKDDAPVLSKEERKLKLRLLNKDLSEFAQKKQLTLAKKRFEQAIRKGIKVDVHSYTNLINAYVRCSDLRGAEETILRMKEQQIQPNLVTFTTLLKGYSEMGDMQEASRIYFQCLNAEGGSNVRSLNTFLRACVRTGMTKPALQSYSDFIHRSCSTDTTGQSAKKQKTVGGGAVSTGAGAGDANGADSCCDASTYEYLIGLLCRSGNVATAEKVLSQFTTASNNAGSIAAGGVSAIENTAIYIALATAEALLRGDLQASRKWCDLAVDALKRTETVTLKDSMLKRFQQSESGAGSAVGEKRAKGGADDDGRSVALFLKHRRTELEGQLEGVQEYLGFTATRSGVGSSGAATDKLHAQHRARQVYLQCLSQVLHFGFDGRCDYDSHQLSGAAVVLAQTEVASSSAPASAVDTILQESQQPHIAARLLLALRDKYGLDRCTLPALDNIVSGANSAEPNAVKLHKALKAGLKVAKTGAAAKVFAAVDADSGCINFPALFTPLNTTTDVTASAGGVTTEHLSTLPVKLEICSGDGEWVVAQAGADWVTEAGTRGAAVANVSAGVRQPKALWVALELRCDRIQHTLAHYLLSRPTTPPASAPSTAANNSAGADHALHNLALLSGNAAKIIPERMASGSIAEIFVNHPQPPDRVTGGGGAHAGSDKNQGSHLLTQDFLAQLLRVLKVNGTVTIVTDNQSYGKSLAASLASLPAQSSSPVGSGEGGATKAVLVGGIDRYKLPVDWEHSLDDSHPVQVLAARASAAEKAGQPTPTVQHARTVDLWRGEAGPEVGHVTTASSYFDRMWDLGQKKRRWFIYVKKVVLE
jgi:pentatricopeptide repeat protein